MAEIEFADDLVQIDAEVLAKAFRCSPEDLKQGMRDGIITSRFERGQDEDAGKVRLTFFSVNRRIRVTADDHGNVLTCSVVDFGERPLPRPGTQRRTNQTETAGPGNDGTRLDALLDEAPVGSFPASDPIAICFDAPPAAVRDTSDKG